jgi:hypothetical protein
LEKQNSAGKRHNLSGKNGVSIVRLQTRMHGMTGGGSAPLPTTGRRGIHKITELAYLIDTVTRVDDNITEIGSAIPLFTLIFAPKDRK